MVTKKQSIEFQSQFIEWFIYSINSATITIVSITKSIYTIAISINFIKISVKDRFYLVISSVSIKLRSLFELRRVLLSSRTTRASSSNRESVESDRNLGAILAWNRSIYLDKTFKVLLLYLYLFFFIWYLVHPEILVSPRFVLYLHI